MVWDTSIMATYRAPNGKIINEGHPDATEAAVTTLCDSGHLVEVIYTPGELAAFEAMAKEDTMPKPVFGAKQQTVIDKYTS